MANPRSCNLLGAFIIAAHDRLMQQVATELPMAGQAAAALVVVRHNAGRSVDFLSGALMLSHSGCVRLVDKLCEAGLLERRQGADKRVVTLYLTPAGTKRVEEILRARRASLEEIVAPLGAAQLRQLTGLLEPMLARMTTDEESADVMCRMCEEKVCPQGRCPITLSIHGSSATV